MQIFSEDIEISWLSPTMMASYSASLLEAEKLTYSLLYDLFSWRFKL